MNGNANNALLMQFMKHYLNDNSISLPQPLSEEQVKQLLVLSSQHDVAHLVGVVAEKLPREQQEAFKPFAREQMKAMFRYEKTQRELDRICAVLEKSEIPYIPLKGSVIRRLYPEPWHRTSCDIDILVQLGRLDEAVAALKSQLQYTDKRTDSHDVSMWSPNGVHLELHFDFDEEHVTKEQFWENAVATDGSYRRELTNELLIVAYVAHVAKHFMLGGCGLRPFLDLWLMQRKLSYDATALDLQIREAGLEAFYTKVNALLELWFAEGDTDAFLCQMEEYILPGGVYGNKKNAIAMARTKGTSNWQYLLRRIFPPRQVLKYQYPALSRYPWLLPWYWLCRAVRHALNGKGRDIRAEYRINREFSGDDFQNTDQLLSGLGLKG